VQLRKLQKYNSLQSNSYLHEGYVVFLSGKRTSAQPEKITDVAEVETGETFNWTVQPEATQASIEQVPVLVQPEVILPDTARVVQQQPSMPVQPEETTVVIKPEKHMVNAGETLYSIAKQYQVTVMDIVQWNNLSLDEGIKPGQVLNLQAPETKPPVSKDIVHKVKADDTLFSVARQYGVTIKELMDWNQKKDFALTVGENLKILKKE
jgi:membrane-bound lytic murein transglycosylase D